MLQAHLNDPWAMFLLGSISTTFLFVGIRIVFDFFWNNREAP